MSAKIPHFETMEESELNYIKVRLIVDIFGVGSENDET